MTAGHVPDRAPVPARITMAFDMRGLDGPTVDERVGTFEGNPAGDVDDWEAARAVPTPAQVELIAEVTQLPVEFFYQPMRSGPTHGGAWISWSDKRGCEWVPPDVIDERGVLLRGGIPAEEGPVQIGLFPASQVPAEASPARTSTRPRAARPGRKPKLRAAPPADVVAGPSLIARAELDAAIARGKARWSAR